MKVEKRRVHKDSNARALILGGAALVAIPLAAYALPGLMKTNYEVGRDASAIREKVVDTRPTVVHVPTPSAVRAIYMTSCVAGTPSFREELVSLIEETELNSVVIDIKDFSGTLSFPTENPLLLGAWENSRCGAQDMEDFVAELHGRGIYVIGRVTVFQDPYYSGVRPDLAVKRASDGSVWRDYKELAFIDVGAKEYWDYTVVLAKESYNLGFDELNFDYIRFPSDGDMEDIAFTHTTGSKAEQLEEFYAYLSKHVRDPGLYEEVVHEVTEGESVVPVLSADLFGMTTTNTDDLNIGQVLERAFPYFDYIAPMVYPSHYPTGFNGWVNPNAVPHDVVEFSMTSAVRRAVATTTSVKTLTNTRIGTSTPALYTKDAYDPNVLRPWLQDFDYGGNYDVAKVRAQIQATYDAGLTSWMIWSPSNVYTRGALEKDGQER